MGGVQAGEVRGPGSGIEYFIIPNVVPFDGWRLAPGGGGAVSDAVATGYGGWPESRFKLIRQPDGTYALQTSNGSNFVTALGGGGEVQEYIHCHPGFPGACIDSITDIFHTDATQVLGWEKFTITDLGNCKYTIQTIKGSSSVSIRRRRGYSSRPTVALFRTMRNSSS